MSEKLDSDMPIIKSGGGKGKAKGRKIGRNKRKCAQYRAMHTREKNKAPRVLQSNGVEFAATWASEHGVVSFMKDLIYKKASRQ